MYFYYLRDLIFMHRAVLIKGEFHPTQISSERRIHFRPWPRVRFDDERVLDEREEGMRREERRVDGRRARARGRSEADDVAVCESWPIATSRSWESVCSPGVNGRGLYEPGSS